MDKPSGTPGVAADAPYCNTADIRSFMNAAGLRGMEKTSPESKQEPEREQEFPDRDGEELTMIDPETFYDLLMEQQEQM